LVLNSALRVTHV